jgi:hypothetical protein
MKTTKIKITKFGKVLILAALIGAYLLINLLPRLAHHSIL